MSVGVVVLSFIRRVFDVSFPLHCCSGTFPLGVLLLPPGIKAPTNSTDKVAAKTSDEKNNPNNIKNKVSDFIDTELANYCSSNKYIKDKVGDGPKKIT